MLDKVNYIEFYKDNVRVGFGTLPIEGSSSKDRVEFAKSLNIEYYDYFLFPLRGELSMDSRTSNIKDFI